MRRLTLALLAVALSAACSSDPTAPPECPKAAPAPTADAVNGLPTLVEPLPYACAARGLTR